MDSKGRNHCDPFCNTKCINKINFLPKIYKIREAKVHSDRCYKADPNHQTETHIKNSIIKIIVNLMITTVYNLLQILMVMGLDWGLLEVHNLCCSYKLWVRIKWEIVAVTNLFRVDLFNNWLMLVVDIMENSRKCCAVTRTSMNEK